MQSTVYKRIHLEDISLKVTAILIYCFIIKINNLRTKGHLIFHTFFPRSLGTEHQYLPPESIEALVDL